MLNIFFQAVDSAGGYQSAVLRELDEKVHFQTCLMTVKTSDGADAYEPGKYIPVNYDICEQNQYDKIVDFNELLPLDRGLLEAMHPYELTAIRMLVRNYDRDIYTMDEGMRYYLRHLRFWNHMLLTHEVNYVFFNNTPHHTHDYVIYALAQVYGIRTNVCISTNFENRYFLAETLEDAWERTARLYENKYRRMPEVTLPKDIAQYYDTICHGSKEENEKLVLQGVSRKQEIEDKRRLFRGEMACKKMVKKNLSRLKWQVLRAENHRMRAEGKEAIRREYRYYQRGRMKLREMVNTDYYNRIAGAPQPGEAYIIYFLHYQPEATSLPQGGVFVDQELAVAVLARSAKELGYKLYVKEHFVQPYRNKTFYDDLLNIENVKLIQTGYDSKELVKGSLCGATGNGTVVLESVIRGTPMLIFGESGFQGCPGVYRVGSVQDCKAAIESIRRKKEEGISQRDIRAYLAAFGENSLFSYVYNHEGLKKDSPWFQESKEKLIACITERLRESGLCSLDAGG